MTGSEETGEVPGFRSVASTQIAPASASVARRGDALGAEELRAGQEHGGALGGGERRDVVGVQAREVVDRARAGGQRHRHRAVGVELLDVGAQRDALARGDGAQVREVLVGEGDGLDVDVERVDVARRGQRVDVVHPGVAVVALRDGVGEEPGDAVGAELAAQAHGARLGVDREPVAGLGLEGRRAGASISATSALAWASTSSSDAPAKARALEAIPPPARAISS